MTNAGNYSVVVSNVAGAATSDDAVLTIIQPEPPHIDAISVLPDGQIYLQFSGSPGHYAIEAATNLSNPADWLELTNFLTTMTVFEYTDPQTNLQRRFYRARLLSP
jgi:hypothetical protein